MLSKQDGLQMSFGSVFVKNHENKVSDNKQTENNSNKQKTNTRALIMIVIISLFKTNQKNVRKIDIKILFFERF